MCSYVSWLEFWGGVGRVFAMHGWDTFAKGSYRPLYLYLEDGTPDVRRWRPTAPTPTPRPGSSPDYPRGPQDRSAAAVGRLCVRGRVFFGAAPCVRNETGGP